MLSQIGVDPDSAAFKTSLKLSIKEKIASNSPLTIDALGISIGLPVEAPEGVDPLVLADSFEIAAENENSGFDKILMPAVGGIIQILDAIPTPPVHLLAALGIPADPTSILLPISNIIADILASIGIPNPNEFFLTNLNKITENANKLKNRLDSLVNATRDQIEARANKVAKLLNEIDINLSIDKLKLKLIEKVDEIRERLNQLIPEVSLPTLSDIQNSIITFLGIEIPVIPGISPQEIIAILSNLSLDIPGIGEFFLEIIKIKLEMIAQLALGIPPFLQEAAQKIIGLFATGNFTGIFKTLAESVFGYFFEKFSSARIISLLEVAPSLVATTHALIQVLIGSFIPMIVGLLFGKGLIMKSSAVALGILK